MSDKRLVAPSSLEVELQHLQWKESWYLLNRSFLYSSKSYEANIIAKADNYFINNTTERTAFQVASFCNLKESLSELNMKHAQYTAGTQASFQLFIAMKLLSQLDCYQLVKNVFSITCNFLTMAPQNKIGVGR